MDRTLRATVRPADGKADGTPIARRNQKMPGRLANKQDLGAARAFVFRCTNGKLDVWACRCHSYVVSDSQGGMGVQQCARAARPEARAEQQARLRQQMADMARLIARTEEGLASVGARC